MARILLIETATEVCSAAIAVDGTRAKALVMLQRVLATNSKRPRRMRNRSEVRWVLEEGGACGNEVQPAIVSIADAVPPRSRSQGEPAMHQGVPIMEREWG